MTARHKAGFSLFLMLWVMIGVLFSFTKTNTKMEWNSSPQSDIDILRQLITLPVLPTQVIWQVKEMTPPQRESFGPTDWMLFAVLTFKETHFQKIIEQSPPLPSGYPIFWNAAYIFEWFPEVLKKNLFLEKGVYQWRIQDLREAKVFRRSPLLHGYVVPLREHSQVFLFLYTM